MSLLFTMLPLYVFGNLHCLGMCGPLVMMLGNHRYRLFYFLGRTTSFSLAGFFAGFAGEILNLTLRHYHIPAFTSFFFGSLIFIVGCLTLCGFSIPGMRWISKKLARFNQNISMLILKDQPWPIYLFGFFTIFLPCGQTIVVYSACALYGDPVVGLLNGFMFAGLTSPSLALAMHSIFLIKKLKKYYNTILGLSSLLIACLSICRGLAELEIIPHFIINPHAEPHYHLVIF